MINADIIEKIKDVISGIISRMGISADIETREQPGVLVFNIRTSDSNMLIGQYGVNLSALQYICRVLVRRHVSDQVEFILDVDDYKRKRESYLNNLAESVYKIVNKDKVAVVLKPMPAYERRAIHAALSSYPDVKSESVGEEPRRSVIVHPQGQSPDVKLEELKFEDSSEYVILKK